MYAARLVLPVLVIGMFTVSVGFVYAEPGTPATQGYTTPTTGGSTGGTDTSTAAPGAVQDPNTGSSYDEVGVNGQGGAQTKTVADPCIDKDGKNQCEQGKIPCGTITYNEGNGSVTCSKEPGKDKCDFIPKGAPAVCTLTQLDAASCIASNCFNLSADKQKELGVELVSNDYKPGQGYVSQTPTSNDFQGVQDAFEADRNQTIDQIVDQAIKNPPEVKIQTLTQAGLENYGLISEQEAARRALAYRGPDISSLNPTPAATPAQLDAFYGEGNWANQYQTYQGPFTRGLLTPTELANVIDAGPGAYQGSTFVPTGQGQFAPAPSVQTPVLQTFSNAVALAPQPYAGLQANRSGAPVSGGVYVASDPTGATIAKSIIAGDPTLSGLPSTSGKDLKSILEADTPSGGGALGPRSDSGLPRTTTAAGEALRQTFALDNNSFIASGDYTQPAVYTGGAPGEAIQGLAAITIPPGSSVVNGVEEAVAVQSSGRIVEGPGGVFVENRTAPVPQQPTVTGNVVNQLRSVGSGVANTVYQTGQIIASTARSTWAAIRNILDFGGSVDVSVPLE